jgi:hypothetical protein
VDVDETVTMTEKILHIETLVSIELRLRDSHDIEDDLKMAGSFHLDEMVIGKILHFEGRQHNEGVQCWNLP